MEIKKFTKDKIKDVIDFEKRLREEEQFWGWEINNEYLESVTKSFDDERFKNSISLLAYIDDKIVGRIDTTLVCSHFDGSIKAYLDWICVLKSYRHKKIAQNLMEEIRKRLKDYGATCLVALIAHNKESLNFYRSLKDAKIQDEGIWIDL